MSEPDVGLNVVVPLFQSAQASPPPPPERFAVSWRVTVKGVGSRAAPEGVEGGEAQDVAGGGVGLG